MKKLLGILVLGLLLGALASCDDGCPKGKKRSGGVCLTDWSQYFPTEPWYKKLKDLNPIDYLEKRKRCQKFADMADTVLLGKQRYKGCMSR